MNYTTFPSNSSHNETIIRPAAFADVSYPANPIKLSRLLDTAPDTVRSFLQHVPPTLASIRQGAEAIVAPHIDFRVGLNTYAPAFQALRDSTADVFVVIATSHYGWQDLFIPTFQHFSTPLGVVRTDTELLNELYKRLPYSLTRDEIAHRDEHSIEFEAVWLQHLFGGASLRCFRFWSRHFTHPFSAAHSRI